MNQAHIDLILFDLGGVLIELSGVDQMLEWSSEISSVDQLWHRWLGSDSVRRFETGLIGEEEFATGVIREFGISVDQQAFLSAFNVWPRAIFPGARELLADLARYYRLASVSNTNAMHWNRFTTDWSLDAAFHYNFPSHEVGKLKPDRDYFEHVLHTVRVPADRALFLDDNLINVEGAAALGLHARRAVGVDGARDVCRDFGLRLPES